MSVLKKHIALGAVTAVFAILLDVISKYYVLYTLMQPPKSFRLTSFFDVVLVWNKGISFGLLASNQLYVKWALVALAVSLVILMVHWLVQAENKIQAFGLGLLMGGAVGNIIDRVRFGAVVDFISWHYNAYYFPVFNVADACITLGVAALIIDQILQWKQKK